MSLRTIHAPASFGSDTSVQGTNDDAQVSKLSCTKAGYFKDDFIQYFVRRASRRSPLINRGYFSRYAALRTLLNKFLGATHVQHGQKQVLVLGAGFDTTWFQLHQEGSVPHKYLEVDFKEVTKRKVSIISQQQQLWEHLSSGGEGGNSSLPQADVEAGEMLTEQFSILPVDLRDLPALKAAIQRANLDFNAPTYILSECVLVYMEPEASAAVVRWLGQHFTNAVMVVYEQIKPGDAFGRQMLSNLERRGCPLKGVHSTPTLQAHCARFTQNSWQAATALDMDTIYQQHLDPTDKARIERLEIFDEFEEWHMIQEHYCIAVGINSSDGSISQFGFHMDQSNDRGQ